MTEAGKKDINVLDSIFCICYLIWYKKTKIQVQTLLDSGSEVNAMTPEYASKLSLKVCPTNIKAQKIDNSIIETFQIILASFQVDDTLEKARFFQEMFLLTDLSIEIVLGILFLTFSNTNIKFIYKKLT